MRAWVAVSALYSVCLLAAVGGARPSTAEDTGVSRPGPTGPEYVLRALDVVSLWVYKQPELTMDLRVSPEGYLVVPVLGRMQAAGRSPDTLAAEISHGLMSKLQLVEAQVSLIVKEYAPQRVYVSGGVRTPKEVVMPLDRALTLSQALATAGGLTEDALPAKVRIVRQRPGQASAVVVVDFLAFMRHARADVDELLQAGDSVYVPQLERNGIFVVGGVVKPGYVDLSALAVPYEGLKPVTASQALSLAGGLSVSAIPREARILRPLDRRQDAEVIPVDLEALITQGSGRDHLLEPGDTLFVPMGQGVFVLGQVERGGNYFPPPGGSLTVTKAISMAGGFTRLASTSGVRLVRKDRVVNVDVDSLTRSASANDPVLAPGDIVFVPRGL